MPIDLFDGTELNDIEAFFLTPSGSSFARDKSFAMSSDPRIIGASMDSHAADYGAGRLTMIAHH